MALEIPEEKYRRKRKVRKLKKSEGKLQGNDRWKTQEKRKASEIRGVKEYNSETDEGKEK